MPGYPRLSSALTGAAADSTRAAESLLRGGNPERAVLLLEEALEASLLHDPVMPGWLCGRLAALYRTLGRLDDEVHLLERYRDSQVADDARTRYDARLSKARTLADRHSRRDSGALTSLRNAVRRPRTPLRDRADVAPDVPLPSEATLAALADLACGASAAEFDAGIERALLLYCADAAARGVPLEVQVDGLRRATHGDVPGEVDAAARARRYSVALVRLLALHFTERQGQGPLAGGRAAL